MCWRAASLSKCREQEYNDIWHSLRLPDCRRFPLLLPTLLDDLSTANTFRRLSKWHFQTKPLPAWNAGTHLPSPLASKSTSHLGDIPTNPSGVPRIVRPAGANREGQEVSAAQHERCIQQFAPSVARTPWFRSGPVVTNRCTVAIASARCGPS